MLRVPWIRVGKARKQKKILKLLEQIKKTQNEKIFLKEAKKDYGTEEKGLEPIYVLLSLCI